MQLPEWPDVERVSFRAGLGLMGLAMLARVVCCEIFEETRKTLNFIRTSRKPPEAAKAAALTLEDE